MQYCESKENLSGEKGCYFEGINCLSPLEKLEELFMFLIIIFMFLLSFKQNKKIEQ